MFIPGVIGAWALLNGNRPGKQSAPDSTRDANAEDDTEPPGPGDAVVVTDAAGQTDLIEADAIIVATVSSG